MSKRENAAQQDKHIIDLFTQVFSNFSQSQPWPMLVETSKGKIPVGELLSELSYSSYAYNRQEGMTHEQLLRIGLGNDAMKERFDRENKPYFIWPLVSNGSAIDTDLIVYPMMEKQPEPNVIDITCNVDKEAGVLLDDCTEEWYNSLSITDQKLLEQIKVWKTQFEL